MSLISRICREDTIIPPKINLRVFFYWSILVLAGLKQLHGVQQHLDIPFFDETEYLQKGVGISIQAFNDWGPSYNLWYFLLSKICPDTVQLFYLNYSILTLALPLLLFFFLYVYGISANLSLLFSFSFLMQPLLVSNFTFVSHFCLMVILLAFILIAYLEKRVSKVMTAMIAAYICMYARQEFLLIFATLAGLWVLLLIQEKKIRWSYAYLAFAAVALLLFSVFGFISFRAQGIDRSLFAFKQHFYTNYIFWTKKVLTVDQFDALDIFHGSKTMFQCMLANPAMFAKHVGTNVLNYLINFYKYTENFVLPSPVFRYFGKFKHLLFAGAVLYLLYLLIKKSRRKQCTRFVRLHTFSATLMAVFFGWSFFSIFFIFPERHYIILQTCWWLLLLGLVLDEGSLFIQRQIVLYPIIALLFIFTPAAKDISYYHNMLIDAKKQPNLKTIIYLRTHNDGKTHVLFTTERGFKAYVPDNYHELFLEQDDVRPYIHNGHIDIQQFFTDKNVDLIFMNEKMQKLIQQTLGASGEILLNSPEQMGFRKTLLNIDMKAYLLVKEAHANK